MKKILLILILVFMAAPVYAFTSAIQGVVTGGGAVGAETCQATPFYDSTGTDSIYAPFGTDTYYYGGDQTFVPGASKKICQIEFQVTCMMGDTGGCDQCSYYAELYTLSGTSLDTLMGTSNAVTGVDSWASTPVVFTFDTPFDVVGTTTYAAVLKTNTQAANCYARAHGKSGTGKISYWGSNKAIIDYNTGITEIRVFSYE